MRVLPDRLYMIPIFVIFVRNHQVTIHSIRLPSYVVTENRRLSISVFGNGGYDENYYLIPNNWYRPQ